MRMPEEINRILTDQISDILFCPTQVAVNNLNKEGFGNKQVKIKVVGDIMYDSALHYKEKMKKPSDLIEKDSNILVTIHRQENTNDLKRLKNIIASLNSLAKEGINLIWPMHPRTKKIIENQNWEIKYNCLPPVGYLEMLYLLDKSSLVITDSGGLQKEAYFFNTFCLTLRDSTEWVELVENGVNTLVDVEVLNLVDTLKSYLGKTIDNSCQIYGQGNTAILILNELERYSTSMV